TEEYRRAHPELELPASVTKNLLNYMDATFLYPESTSEAQAKALEQLNKELGGNANLQSRNTLWQTMQAFYSAEAECILLSDTIVDMLEETEEYANFRNETIILKTFRTEIEIPEIRSESITENPFTVFVAGNDTRSGILSIYGRTDVDILLTVNPKTAQALIISIPRDTYIPNPALDYGADKLTHLGNHGIMNTIEALNALYRINVKYYATVNFNTFKTVVNTIGGIDINNPYDFQGINRYFYKGETHLNGEDALDYVRERHTLSSGDFDRNEHQAIVLKAILQKLTSRDILLKAGTLLENLSGTVATNIKPASILELASQELIAGHDWNIIYYHLGGYGTRAETVSMPGMQLYVVYPYSSQIIFVGEEIQRVLDGEILEQKELPDADKTVWEYN
ncbi:MAG: LCP family protein, partial [Erysipelotrichaceae bacterium]|nr:LCP family protein [Erysipelotrichaceae bacterium]